LSFSIDEGLHTQTHAVDARSNQRVKGFAGNLTWRALDGDFGIRVEMKICPNGGKEILNQAWSKQAGGSTAQVNGVDTPGQIYVDLPGPLAGRLQIVDEAVNITRVLAGRINARGKVAVGALRPAKGDGDVEPQRVVLISGHKEIVSRRQAVTRHRVRQPGSCHH